MSLNPYIVVFLIFCFAKYVNARRARSKLDGIPTIGPNGIFTSYWTVWSYVLDGRKVIEEGCRKYPNTAFKVPTINGWQIVVSGQKMIDDIRHAADEELSNMEAIEDLLKSRYTMPPTTHMNPYHVDVIRTTLTRNIGAKFDEVLDEIKTSFDEIVPVRDEWVEFPAVATIQSIVVRASNRLFVGLPLCRDPDYCDLNIKFTIQVVVNSLLIDLFPNFLHPIVGRILTTRKSSLRRAMRHLAPIIEERMEMERQYGKDWTDKPNDAITWLLEMNAQSGEDWQKGSVEDIAIRVLAMNFAAIHTTSMSFTHALYHLAANPHVTEPLRNEVEAVIAKEGWSKAAMVQLRLMDSFLKESQRHVGAGAVGLKRVTVKDFTFSDGTVVPANTLIGAASYATLHNPAVYTSPKDFNATRFSDLRTRDGEGIKHQMVTPTNEWVVFGIGKHACPGRFFAVNELKAMLSHILLTYDVRVEDDQFPPSDFYAGSSSPNTKAKVMFRKRQISDSAK
ncbi:cytochrome P450 [Marasmius fiardii PR-910]|nr:cytochrome P450 [Marasmius fiardii PR-910]